MMLRNFSLAGIALCLAAGPATAHHSFAMFDMDRTVTLTNATVDELEWTNPHSWLHLVSRGQNGQEEWILELGSVIEQTRIGWKADTVKPGDKVTVEIHPQKDGSRGGTVASILLPNGQRLNRGGRVNNPFGRD